MKMEGLINVGEFLFGSFNYFSVMFSDEYFGKKSFFNEWICA
jgi:hypothetical protein